MKSSIHIMQKQKLEKKERETERKEKRKKETRNYPGSKLSWLKFPVTLSQNTLTCTVLTTLALLLPSFPTIPPTHPSLVRSTGCAWGNAGKGTKICKLFKFQIFLKLPSFPAIPPPHPSTVGFMGS